MKEYVYALVCPILDEYKYIGKTKNPKRRYNQHLKKLDKQFTPKRKWLEKLIEKDLMPKLVILKEVDGDARAEEQYFCNIHKNTILNIHNPEKGAKSNKW